MPEPNEAEVSRRLAAVLIGAEAHQLVDRRQVENPARACEQATAALRARAQALLVQEWVSGLSDGSSA